MNSKSHLLCREPPSGDWPSEDLEFLGACPVCQCPDRTLLYTGLQDRTFFAAPGNWQMWQCEHCSVGYLDPRPTKNSIERAYAGYYTHTGAAAVNNTRLRQRLISRIRQGFRNDYLKAQYGHKLQPTIWGGRFIARFRTLKSYTVGSSIRHLSAPTLGSCRLLDIGSGDGSFVRLARDVLGYEAEGLEFDSQAIEQSREKGGVIHQGMLPGSELTPSTYDQVTLKDVLEHLHDPVTALEEALALLRTGGRIWIQVPSLDGASNATFGVHSRLLEPPRHLVMFGVNSLKRLMEKIGFVRVDQVPMAYPLRSIFLQSWAIENGYDPRSVDWCDLPKFLQDKALAAERVYSGISPSADSITMIGYKTSAPVS
jgi:2-polyprenyl-3-methyl-5-hydroxy-6-metoxy-1,4-benzoquinol methylase